MRPEFEGILRDVRENIAKLRGCPRHRYPGGHVSKMGAKYVCLECGGSMDLIAIGSYVAGYAAAGADINDIWPGWATAKDPQ